MQRFRIKPRREQLDHPHAHAAYRVYRLDDGAYGVEVTIPNTFPTKVSSFRSRGAAHEWIAEHKWTVSQQRSLARRPGFIPRGSKAVRPFLAVRTHEQRKA